MTINQEEIDQAAAVLRSGGLVAFPTETVYGLGADASNPAAVRKLYETKGRPANHPVIVHLVDPTQLLQWVEDVPPAAKTLAQHFWPGPLTMVFKRQSQVGDYVTGGQDTIGVRVPAHPVARVLIEKFGSGVAAPSANRFGHVSPTTAAHVRQEFGNDVMVLDGGQSEVGIESTILDVTQHPPVMLRPGHITAAAIAAVLGVSPVASSSTAPRVSGGLAAHYAPQTPVKLLPAAQLVQKAANIAQHNGKSVAVLARSILRPRQGDYVWLLVPEDVHGYAHALYATLRQLDDACCSVILVEEPPQTAEWIGVNDRLRRAVAGSEQPK